MDEEFLNTDGEHAHDSSVKSVSCQFEDELVLHELRAWIGEIVQCLGADLYRYKGVLAVAGKAEQFVFQGVGMLFDGRFGKPWPDGKRESRFVFIGKHIDKDLLLPGFLS